MIDQLASMLLAVITSALPSPSMVTSSPPATFEAAARDFRVAFPTAPQISGHAPASDDDSGSWVYAVHLNGRAFMVRIDQYPDRIRVPAPNPRTYELLLRAHAEESASRLVSIKPVAVGGIAGLEGEFVGKNGAGEAMRVLMVGRRVYQVSYALPAGDNGSDQGHEFLTSFQLTAR